MNRQYSSLAFCYDRLNAHVGYDRWVGYILDRFREAGIPSGALVLDLACGTGSIALPLSERGYDVIALDASPEMLDCGRKKPGGDRILWLCQDMRSFELYGTVAAVVCCLDSINYITGRQGLRRCFSLVHNYLDPGGLFLFDVNSPYKFRTVYGEQQYVIDAPGVCCCWRNHFDPKAGLCDFELSIFAEEADGHYRRYEELQRERCWSRPVLTDALTAAGFELLSVAGDFDMTPPTDTSERFFFVCRSV